MDAAFSLGFYLVVAMLLCLPVLAWWSKYVKESKPSPLVRWVGTSLCVVLYLIIYCCLAAWYIKSEDDAMRSRSAPSDPGTITLMR